MLCVVIVGAAGSLTAGGILCNNTKATIDGTVQLAAGKAIEVKGTGELLLGGVSDLFAEVQADATAKVVRSASCYWLVLNFPTKNYDFSNNNNFNISKK